MSGIKRYALFVVCAVALTGLHVSSGWCDTDAATHETDHLADEDIPVLEPVHVHGLRLNTDQQRGPVPTYTPWPAMPSALHGQAIDDWMKVRILVSKTAETTVVVLEPAQDRQLNAAGLQTLQRWKFDPQMQGDDFVDGDLTVSIHFRTREP